LARDVSADLRDLEPNGGVVPPPVDPPKVCLNCASESGIGAVAETELVAMPLSRDGADLDGHITTVDFFLDRPDLHLAEKGAGTQVPLECQQFR